MAMGRSESNVIEFALDRMYKQENESKKSELSRQDQQSES